MVENAIELVGLPVKCHRCHAKGFVKPRTDYGGWYHWKAYHKSHWFCTECADGARNVREGVTQRYLTPEPKPAPEDVTEELYKLLD